MGGHCKGQTDESAHSEHASHRAEPENPDIQQRKRFGRNRGKHDQHEGSASRHSVNHPDEERLFPDFRAMMLKFRMLMRLASVCLVQVRVDMKMTVMLMSVDMEPSPLVNFPQYVRA